MLEYQVLMNSSLHASLLLIMVATFFLFFFIFLHPILSLVFLIGSSVGSFVVYLILLLQFLSATSADVQSLPPSPPQWRWGCISFISGSVQGSLGSFALASALSHVRLFSFSVLIIYTIRYQGAKLLIKCVRGLFFLGKTSEQMCCSWEVPMFPQWKRICSRRDSEQGL